MKAAFFSIAATLIAAPALASTVSVSSFSKSAYESAVASMGRAETQDFESYGEQNINDGFETNVGKFSTLGGKGTGATVTGADFDNDGTKLALRDGNVFGRVSTTGDLTETGYAGTFLDSNDTLGIVWHVFLGAERMFDSIVFTVTDAAEFGNSMLISTPVGSTMISSGSNGVKRLVEVYFNEAVTSATITLSHFKGSNPTTNDGFSIDDIAVGEVPLPASALLLLGGLGGLAAMRRRQA